MDEVRVGQVWKWRGREWTVVDVSDDGIVAESVVTYREEFTTRAFPDHGNLLRDEHGNEEGEHE